MPRKSTLLESLATRKRLLLAESELNRTELLKEVEHFKGEFTRVKKQVKTVGSIASSAAVIATAATLFHHHRQPENHEKKNGTGKVPWITAALEGARVGTSLFLKIRSLLRERERD